MGLLMRARITGRRRRWLNLDKLPALFIASSHKPAASASAGSGFSEKGLKDAVDRMKPLFIDKCPFVNPPNTKEKIQWVQPQLVCEVEYTELTAYD